MKRRRFIQLSATASAAALLPFELKAIMESDVVKNCDFSNRKLVLINLDGGNDGLNTIIPLNQYDTYSSLRPSIKVPDSGLNKYINLDTTLPENQLVGLHPALTNFKDLYDAGKMRVIQSVGYPSQNKSHFASSDVYMTGNDGNSWLNGKDSGWIGRFMEQMYIDDLSANYPLAVQLGNLKNSLGFHGLYEHGLNMNITNQDASGFYSVLNGLAGEAPNNIALNSDYGVELDYIVQTDRLANVYANAISNAFNTGSNATTYPDNDLSDQLKTVARLIKGGLDSKIYMVRLSGFDTHANQLQTEVSSGSIAGRHDTLMQILNGAVAAFMTDLKSLELDDEVTALTYSEFGRKVAENGNLGTDHGEVAPMFVFGKTIQGGISGINPDLSEATEDNNWQIETVQHDYRAVFGTMLKDWMGADDTIIDQTFFDHTNNDSFTSNPVEELIIENYKINADCLTTTSIDDELAVNANQSWFASPNPFVDNLTLRSENDHDKILIQVYNQNGKLVKATNVQYSNGQVNLNLANLAKGNYFIHIIEADNQKKALKVIKR